MSEAKHTPGPWWVTESGVRDRGGYICHTRPAQHYPDQDERFEKETTERAANKTLISAAPELLDACMAMLEWDDREKDHAIDFNARMDLCRAAFDKARAAIAKATGQPND